MPSEKLLLLDYLLFHLDHETFPHLLEWTDRDSGEFLIWLKRINSKGWTIGHAAVYIGWDEVNNRPQFETTKYYSKSRHALISALGRLVEDHQLEWLQEIPDEKIIKYKFPQNENGAHGGIALPVLQTTNASLADNYTLPTLAGEKAGDLRVPKLPRRACLLFATVGANHSPHGWKGRTSAPDCAEGGLNGALYIKVAVRKEGEERKEVHHIKYNLSDLINFTFCKKENCVFEITDAQLVDNNIFQIKSDSPDVTMQEVPVVENVLADANQSNLCTAGCLAESSGDVGLIKDAENIPSENTLVASGPMDITDKELHDLQLDLFSDLGGVQCI